MSLGAGRPDWTPLNVQGSFEIASIAGAYSSGDTLFSGFVGTWAYLNVLTTGFTTASYVQYTITYYTSAAYQTQAGVQKFTRYYDQTANTQYAVLGPWCKITITTDTGGGVALNALNVYGSQGGAGPARLAPAAAPLCYLYTTMAAGANDTVAAATVAPGPAVLVLRAGVSSWALYVNYYDFASAGFLTWWSADSNVAGYGGSWAVPLPDTRVEIQVFNNATTANSVKCMLLPGSY